MPNQDDKNDKAALIAQKVMHRISEGTLRPIPAVYAVLYAHYSGQNPDISREISLLNADNKIITTTICEQLFDMYMSPKREQQFVDEAVRKVQLAMNEITEMIRHSGVAHSEYNETLIRQSDNLSSATDLAEVKNMVRELMDDTHRMVEENKKLEDKLSHSSQELTQMREDMQSLKQETMTDSLTAIPNRKAFDSELRTRAREAIEKSQPLCMIMIDIDHFKTFNDTYGHPVGDQVLRLVARTLSEGLRPTELLARYGGEEFAVIAPAMKLKEAEKLAEKLRQRIATKDIINMTKNERLGNLSISLGVTQLHPGESLNNLVERSDHALYKAKAAGRNTVVGVEYDKDLQPVMHNDILIDTIN